MNSVLQIILIILCIVSIIGLFYLIRKGKLPIKYSIIWFIPAIVILLLAIFPKVISFFTSKVGMMSTNSFIISVILTLLLLITLILTLIIANLKRKITLLIQEVSMLKEKK